ncbi:MAG: NADH-quinone oxidoreductase subunit J [Planctomycetota bacterium]|jgi:NADH-quinone oxidoreductase subunit J
MEAGEILVNVIFYDVALLGLAGALAVALSKNIVRSAFSLLLVLFAAAALFALMKADFLFAIQVLVYVGGILVLIIFAVMLTHKITDVRVSNLSAPGPVAFVAVMLVLFTLCFLVLTYPGWPKADLSDEALGDRYAAAAEGFAEQTREAAGEQGAKHDLPESRSMTKTIGYALMSRYLLPFEAVSMLLLAALIGAAFLARKEVRE